MNWPWRTVAAGGLLGLTFLALGFNSYWPATHWTVLAKEQLVQKGREAAATLGVDITNWRVSTAVRLSKPLSYFSVEHPREAQNEHVSPLSLRITYRAPKGDESAEVGVNSAGELIYWKPPASFKGKIAFDSDELAAQAGFQFFAGKAAGSYKSSGRRMGDEAHEEIYIWKRTPAANSDLRQTITVQTKDAVIETIEAKASLFSVDDDSETGDKAEYWEVLSAIFQLICVLGTIAFIVIYILWLARKALSHNFPIRMAVAFWLAVTAAGLIRNHGAAGDVNFAGAFFSALTLLCLVSAARSISQDGRSKWFSLEQIFQLAPLAKATGGSFSAGLAAGPLLAAIPFAIAACGLFPHSWVLPYNADLLYSSPVLANCVDSSTLLLLLGFFGFGLAAVQRVIRLRWLRWLIIIPAATIFFANEPRLISGPLAAPLTEGLLTFAVLLFLRQYFDLLAVLVAQFTSTVLLDIFLLHQKGTSVGALVAVLICFALAAAYCLWRGQEVGGRRPASQRSTHRRFSSRTRETQGRVFYRRPGPAGHAASDSATHSRMHGGCLMHAIA